MAAFTLDTSGAVNPISPNGEPMPHLGTVWPDLSPFAQGYVEAALNAGVEHDCEGRAYPELDGIGFRHLARATLAAMVKDCEVMYARRDWWGDDGELSAGQTDQEAGAELWRDRQAERWPESFPPLTLYLADDGLIYHREAA